MITITRRLALQLRSVLRRAFGSRNTGTVVGFIADKAGLTVRSMYADAVVELRVPGERPVDTLWLPLEFLADIEGKKDDPVELQASGNDQVTAHWQDGKVPQLVRYDAKEPTYKSPALPATFATNRPNLLQALHEASEITDPSNERYAVGCLQLCPDGTINATDGRQALIQSGFTFPWSVPLLIPRSKVFRSPELSDKPVAVAQSGDWVVLNVEPWTIYLQINTDGRFPDMTWVVPDPATATTRCQLSADDKRFLNDTLPRLPYNDEYNLPVTLDLNGHVAIRAKPADDKAQPTEVVLTNSSCSGEPVRININRTYLSRALKLGIQEFCLFGDNAALLGVSDNRKYVWMPLEPGSAIESAEGSICIASPKAETSGSPSPKPKTERKPVSDTNNTTKSVSQTKPETASAKPARRKAGQQDITGLIEQAVQFRTVLRDLMQQSSGLVKALKQHRRQSKVIRTTLESLKQLKTLGV